MTLLRLFLFVTCVVALVQAHGTGAPSTACKSMVPDHSGANNIQGANPQYRLEAPAHVSPGQTTQIILRGAPFLGFMVRALNAQGLSGGGYFAEGQGFQALSCDGNGDSATHDSPSPKTQVNLLWYAPTEPGVYRVMATIVKEYTTFYSGYFTDVTVQ